MANFRIQYSKYLPAFDAAVLEIVDADAPPTHVLAATVTVYFSADSGHDNPVNVDLKVATGITPTMLQRLPWGRWLAAADAERRGDRDARWAALGIKVTNEKRPGRKGHDRSHYEAVAKRYLELRAKGVEAPAKIIAREGFYNENTVRGWVRQCRALGLLPAARPGKAG